MANPSSDFPANLHSVIDTSGFDNLRLGATTPKHTDVHGKIEEELISIQRKIGMGSSTPTNGKYLKGNGDGTSEWADVSIPVINSLADITNHSHTVLTDIGTNTHSQIDTFIGTTVPNNYVKLDQTVGQTIGATGARLTKLWATDITVTNAITGSVTGNAGTVTNATFTTPLTVNTGSVTLSGNVANTSVLTIGAGAVSVSGTNTGDVTLGTNTASGLSLSGQQLSLNDVFVQVAGDTMTGGLTITPGTDTTTALKVTDKDSNSEFVIDTSTDTITAQGATITGIATTYTRMRSLEIHPQVLRGLNSTSCFAEDANYIYVGSTTAKPAITRILKSDTTVQTVLEFPPNVPCASIGLLKVDPVGKWMYVGQSGSGASPVAIRINLYDFATVEVRTKGMANKGFNYVCSPDNVYVYILTFKAASTCEVIKVATASFLTDTGVTCSVAGGNLGSYGLGIDPSGTYVYAKDAIIGSNSIAKITTASMTKTTLTISAEPTQIEVDPTNTYIFYKTSSGVFGRILVSDFSTTVTKTISRSGYTLSQLTTFAFDSTYIYFAMYHASSPFCNGRLTISDFTTVAYYDPSAGTASPIGASVSLLPTSTTLYTLTVATGNSMGIHQLSTSSFTGGSMLCYLNHTGIGYCSSTTNSYQLASPDGAYIYTTTISLSSGSVQRYKVADGTISSLSLIIAAQAMDIQTNARQFTIDSASTYLWTTIRNSRTTETYIVKVDLSDFTTVTWTSIGNKSSAVAGVAIDSTSTNLYISYVANPVVVEKYTVSTLVLAATLTLTGVSGTTNANILIDTTNTYLYVLPNGSTTQINRITLADFTTITTRSFSELGGTGFAGGVIDSTSAYLYADRSGTRKIDLTNFAAGAYTSSSSVGTPTSIDNTNGVVFCPNSTTGLGIVTISDMSSYNIAPPAGSPMPAINRFINATSFDSGRQLLCLTANTATSSGTYPYRNKYVLFIRRPVNYETTTNLPMAFLNSGTKSVLASTESRYMNVFGDEMAYTTVQGENTFIASQFTTIDGMLKVTGAIASFVGIGADTIAGKSMTGLNIIQTGQNGKLIFDADAGSNTYISNVSATSSLDTYLDGTLKTSLKPAGMAISSSILLPYVAKTADYTAGANDYTVAVTCSLANITITLPAASGCTGRIYNIKKMDATAYTVIVDGDSSETIDGDTTQTIANQYDSVQIQSTGSNWIII